MKKSPLASNGDFFSRWLKRPLLFWVRLILGIIFIAASLGKIVSPQEFALVIERYQIFPPFLINMVAIILPWMELFLGLFLIAGIWLPGCILLSNFLLVAFWCALVFNLARGLNIDCGCFSTKATEDPTTLWYVLRDSAFLALGGYLFWKVLLAQPLKSSTL